LSRIKGHEKAILIAIAFLITATISFSLGVEKGKNLAAQRTNLRIDVASSKAVAGSARQPELAQQKKPSEFSGKAAEAPQNYTIQLASFSSKTSAEKEVAFLRKKGYTPLVIPKGKYIMLCVGNFSDKETASKVLAEFKKRYSDCRVRRL